MAQASFPQNVKTWTDKTDFVDDVVAKDTNEAYAELIAMQKYIKPVADTGTANAYVATVENVTDYFDGLTVLVKIANANTGVSTLNINSLGVKSIKKEKDIGLSANDLKAGQYVTFVYDGTNFQLVSAVNGLVAHKAEITSHSEAVNRTITVGTGKDFTTIQEAINSIKKRIDAIITINVDAGTYAESVSINGFLGSGAIIINGGNSLETAVNYSVNAFFISFSTVIIEVIGFIATSSTYPFRNTHCMSTVFKYCTSTSVGTIGFCFDRANGGCDNCLASNKTNAALYVAAGATVFSNSWTAGSNNAIGIQCRSASTVGKYGTQPQGTTAELVDQGGVIR